MTTYFESDDFCLAQYLEVVSNDTPAGDDISADYDYLYVFHQLARGKPETQWSDAVEVDWPKVLKECHRLMARTRDVRLTVLTAVALFHTNKMAGLADGLKLLHGQLDRFWSSIHPRPDAGDGHHPIGRLNAISELILPAGNLGGPYAIGQWFRELLSTSDGTPAAEMSAIADAANCAAAACREIECLVAEYVGREPGVSLATLHEALTDGADALCRSCLVVDVGSGGLVTPLATATPRQSSQSRRDEFPANTAVRSRDEVKAAIDGICDYYAQYEPSSPVPLLLARVRRLVSMSFADVIRDLAPDALERLSELSGTDLRQITEEND